MGNDDGGNGGQGRAANVPVIQPRPPPTEFETPDANEAVNFILDNMEHPKLFDLHCVRSKEVVAALQSRGKSAPGNTVRHMRRFFTTTLLLGLVS